MMSQLSAPFQNSPAAAPTGPSTKFAESAIGTVLPLMTAVPPSAPTVLQLKFVP